MAKMLSYLNSVGVGFELIDNKPDKEHAYTSR